jgi:HSP20 family protein
MRNLIPWGRDRRSLLPVAQSGDDSSPFFTLQRQVNRLFDDIWRDFDTPLVGHNGWSTRWPEVDVSESDKEIKVIADIPGLSEKDIEVTLRDGVLALKGDKKLEHKNSAYREIWEGHFERTIDVGDVDPDKVRAEFKNGQLTIAMEKRPEAQRRVKRIPINGH